MFLFCNDGICIGLTMFSDLHKVQGGDEFRILGVHDQSLRFTIIAKLNLIRHYFFALFEIFKDATSQMSIPIVPGLPVA